MLVWLHAPPQHCTLWHNLMNFWDTLGLHHPPDFFLYVFQYRNVLKAVFRQIHLSLGMFYFNILELHVVVMALW